MKKIMVTLFLLSVSYPVMPMMDLFLGTGSKPKAPNNPVQTQPQKKEPTHTQKTETITLPKIDGPTIIQLHVHIDVDSGNTITVNNQSQSSAASVSSAEAQAEAQVDVEVSQSNDMYQERMQTFWDDNKFYIGAGGVIGLYSYYCYQVICGNLYLKKTDLWSSWKHELSFDQLCLIPQQTLARELILSIQHQGIDMQKPTDFMVPLVLFLHVIEEERRELLYYQTLYRRISMLKCRFLFPFNRKRYNHIEERLRRLSFVKNIFISWMAEFNVEHNRSLTQL